MARSKALPARKAQARDEESLLLRSAESLGRMIGTLQRQLDDVAGRLSTTPAPKTASKPGVGTVSPLRRPSSARGSSRRSSTTKQAAKKGNGHVTASAPKRARKTTAKKTSRER